MKLTVREVIIAAASFMHGYGLGHNDTVEGVFSGEDPEAALELIVEHAEDDGLTYGMTRVEAVLTSDHLTRG